MKASSIRLLADSLSARRELSSAKSEHWITNQCYIFLGIWKLKNDVTMLGSGWQNELSKVYANAENLLRKAMEHAQLAVNTIVNF